MRSLFVITCSVYASLTLAQSYVGLKLGHAEIMSDLESSSSLGWYLGHAVSENFAVELNYDSFGDADIEGVDVELSADALSVYGVFKVDIKTSIKNLFSPVPEVDIAVISPPDSTIATKGGRDGYGDHEAAHQKRSIDHLVRLV